MRLPPERWGARRLRRRVELTPRPRARGRAPGPGSGTRIRDPGLAAGGGRCVFGAAERAGSASPPAPLRALPQAGPPARPPFPGAGPLPPSRPGDVICTKLSASRPSRGPESSRPRPGPRRLFVERWAPLAPA